ncbi:Aste57867_18844 [Aphanomyces stellatus]|uniref:Aste57867_18844 protein n=1 Tax=Aphanomyces stellatus TaxID=120398 RepID=A0A485LC06_9STRA|nr:hypothetical protein As57867_018780 [Aphanomyces stellatus]VFT95578.1 Aste57867_18844 [Aphanomyces stellatus]
METVPRLQRTASHPSPYYSLDDALGKPGWRFVLMCLPSPTIASFVESLLLILAGIAFFPGRAFTTAWTREVPFSHAFFLAAAVTKLYVHLVGFFCPVRTLTLTHPPTCGCGRDVPTPLRLVHVAASALLVAGSIHLLVHAPYYTDADTDVRGILFVTAFTLTTGALGLELLRWNRHGSHWRVVALLLLIGQTMCLLASAHLVSIHPPADWTAPYFPIPAVTDDITTTNSKDGDDGDIRDVITTSAADFIGGGLLCMVAHVLQFMHARSPPPPVDATTV